MGTLPVTVYKHSTGSITREYDRSSGVGRRTAASRSGERDHATADDGQRAEADAD
jgi:hypothetical protein